MSLTPYRLIWADFGDPNCRLSLHHSLVLGLEKTGKSWLKSGKILLHLAPVAPGTQVGVETLLWLLQEEIGFGFPLADLAR